MITICSEFATEYDVTFNPSKTACMAFGNRHVCPDLHLYLDGKMLEWTDTFKHLGNVITVDQKDDSDIQLKRGNFYRSVNGLCYKFKCTLLNSDVASRLFQTYCCSFYGSQAWNLSSSSFEFICTAWNKAVRRIFHLPYNTHRYLLPFIVQTSHIRYQLVERFRTFFATCMSSENLLINLLALNAHFCNSPMSMNRRYADKLLVKKNDLTEEESGHAALLSSLLKIREQQWSIPNFDRNEIEMMVEFICTAWSRFSMTYSLEQMIWFFPCANFYVCIFFVWDQCVRINWWFDNNVLAHWSREIYGHHSPDDSIKTVFYSHCE